MKKIIYVNNKSNDNCDIRTIEQAVKIAKEVEININEVDIVLQDGLYSIDENVLISGKDFSHLKLTIKAENEGKATLTNASKINKEDFNHITDDMDINIPVEARNHVLYCDVKANSIIPKVYGNKSRYTISKWPNEGYVKVKEVLEIGHTFVSENTGGREYIPPEERNPKKRACFKLSNDKIKNWIDAKQAIIEGYFYYDWRYEKIPLREIDIKENTITLEEPTTYGIRKDQRLLIANLIEELDIPGEFYLDSVNNRLYIYPFINDDEIYLASSNKPSLDIRHASNVTIEGIRFAYSKERMIDIESSSCCKIINCIFEYCGTNAISINKCTNVTVEDNNFQNLGSGGVMLNGGDRKELIPGCNIIKGNEFSFFSIVERTYTPAIHLNGCGNSVCENIIHDTPHCAIIYSGNNHLIENNEIYNCAFETDDVGIIYCGRDWTIRGNIIRGNLLYDNHSSEPIYFDDLSGSTEVYNNIIAGTKRRAILIAGGRDNTILNNIFIACENGISLDDWGTRGGRYCYQKPDGTDSTLLIKLKEMPYKSDLWKEFYPKLYEILDDKPEYPRNNIIVDNIMINCGESIQKEKAFENNIFDYSLDYKGDLNEILNDFLINKHTDEYKDNEKIDKILESFIGTWTINKFKGKYLEIIECLENYKL